MAASARNASAPRRLVVAVKKLVIGLSLPLNRE